MKTIFTLMLTAILTDNIVLSKFMGICPFLGVSKKLSSSLGMGAAVIFVMACATVVNQKSEGTSLAARAQDSQRRCQGSQLTADLIPQPFGFPRSPHALDL